MIDESLEIMNDSLKNYEDSIDYIRIKTIFKLNFLEPKAQNKYQFMKKKAFKEKYQLFIELIYFSLKMEIPIFQYHKNTMAMHSFHKVFQAINQREKLLIIEIQNEQNDFIKGSDNDKYINLLEQHISKMKILSNLRIKLKEMIDDKTIKYVNNPFDLLNSYLCQLSNHIESYCDESFT